MPGMEADAMPTNSDAMAPVDIDAGLYADAMPPQADAQPPLADASPPTADAMPTFVGGTVIPANVTMRVGPTPEIFHFEARFSDGSTKTVTNDRTMWVSNGPSIVNFTYQTSAAYGISPGGPVQIIVYYWPPGGGNAFIGQAHVTVTR